MKENKETISMLEQLLSNSIIFKPSEITIMIKRLNGDYKDKCGIFSNKIKPKILEIMMWSSPNFKKTLKKIIKQKRNTTQMSDVERFLEKKTQ